LRDGVVISLDGMGGDNAPEIVVEGAYLSSQRYPDSKFIIFGDENKIRPLVDRYKGFSAVCEVVHTPDKILSEDKPSQALRAGRNSSMRLAINAVDEGRADCIVSAGNTGALMAISKFVLKVLPGVTRPAIATYLPTRKPNKKVVMLDLGANVECTPKMLLEFGVLGEVFSREVLNVAKPKIGLLNIGSEALKGNQTVQDAALLFEQADCLSGEYIGFVEGDDIGRGEVDVIVTDGFTGNVALKTIEGTAKLISGMIKDTFKSSWLMKFATWLFIPGLLVSLPALLMTKRRIDPRYYNGASLMGLKGLCIKSHGGTDSVGFANAIEVAINMARTDFNKKVASELEAICVSNNEEISTEE